jgi:WD40 repeat protein/serine/threonine protein kinase
LAEALETYLALDEEGAAPPPHEFAGRYPDLADELNACLDSLHFIGKTVGPAGSAPGLSAGQAFGDYEILHEIGRGGMGAVYEAFHTRLERRVALKVLSGQEFNEEAQRTGFLREAKTAAQLHHTNIIPIFEVGEQDGVCYYSMQLIRGRNLREWLQRRRDPVPRPPATDEIGVRTTAVQRPADEPAAPAAAGMGSAEPAAVTPCWDDAASRAAYFREVTHLVAQAADALEYAHRHGVVHRDIKPSNLIVDEVGVVWIADFGLALRSHERPAAGTSDPVGTPLYMSPEQAAPGATAIDHRTDIYSLGATLYELLTLQPMFRGPTALSVLTQIVQDTPPPPRAVNRFIPRDLNSVVRKATAKQPDARYQSAQQLADDLHRFLRHEPVGARRVGALGRVARWCRREPALAGMSAAFAALVLLVVGLSYTTILRDRNAAVAAKGRAELARQEAESAKSLSQARLWDALYQQARATRLSQQTGRRIQSIDLLRRAWALRPDASLRDELIAALSITDARLLSRQGTPTAIHAMAFSPDGQRLAWATLDGNLHHGNPESPPQTWTTLRESNESDARIDAVAFSPDSRFLARAAGNEVEVWDVPQGRLLHLIHTPGLEARLLAFIADGSRLLAMDRNGGARSWDIGKSKLGWNPEQDARPWTAAAVPQDRRGVTLVRPDGHVDQWDPATETSQRLSRYPVSADGACRITWVPGGRMLAVATMFGAVELRDLEQAEPITVFGGHRGPVLAPAFSPDGTLVATSGLFDPDIKLRDVATGELLMTLREPQSGNLALLFSPSGDRLVAGGYDRKLWVWEVARPAVSDRFVASDGPFSRLAYSPDGRRLAAAGGDGKVVVWDVAHKSPPVRLTMQSDQESSTRTCSGLAFSPSGRLLAWMDRGGCIQVWDLVENTRRASLPSSRHYGWARGLWFLDETRLLLGVGRTEVWDFTLPDSPHVTGDPRDIVVALAVDNRRQMVVVGSGRHRTVQKFDINGKSSGLPMRVRSTVTSVAVSSEGQRIAAGERSGMVQVWDSRSGRNVYRWQESSEEVSAVEFSPNGRWLAVASTDGTIRLRDVASGALAAQFVAPSGAVKHLAFSPDGSNLAVCSEDKVVEVWQLEAVQQQLAALGVKW